MKIVFFGTPQPVVQILQTLFNQFDVVGVVTGPDHLDIRKKKLIPTSVKAAALLYNEDVSRRKTYSVQIFTPKKLDEQFRKELELLKPEMFIVAAYGKILSKTLLEIPHFGALCVHPSLLPKYRGPSPIPQTILDGEKITGTSIIKMDEKTDHGPILVSKTYPVHPTDTYETLMNHLFKLGAELLPETMTAYADEKINPVAQEDAHATFTKMIKKDSGFIEIDNLPEKEKITRMIHAYYPWPSVWTKIKLNGKEVRIKFLPNMIQMEGKKSQSVKDFLNGYPELRLMTEKIYSI